MSAALTLNYRRPDLTIRCVQSLLADGWPRVLIWDNSDDGGASEAVLRGEFQHEQRVDIVASAENLGFAKGVNRGLAWLDERADSGPVLLVNNDAVTPPGTRNILLARLARERSTALLAPRIDQGGRTDGWMYYVPWMGVVSRRPVPGAMAYLSGCCLLINRDLVPGPVFDERFFMYGEDVELSRRCRCASHGVVLVEEARIQHVGSASSGMGSALYEELTARSRLLLVDSWWPRSPGRRGLAKLTVVALLVLRASIRSLRFHSLVPLRRTWAAVRDGVRLSPFNPGDV